MKAATIARYGSPGLIEVREVPEPVPGQDEVLVRVHAATVNRTDCGELLHPTFIRLMTGIGRSRRTILGMDFAGTVKAVGAAVSMFKPGDRVFGSGAIGTAVTAVVEGRHLELVRSLGADFVVDRGTDAFDQLGRNFDFVLDAVGKLGIRRWRRLLKPSGLFASTDRGPWSQNLLFLLWSKVTGRGRVVVPLPRRGSGKELVTNLRDKMEAGRLIAVIDRRYPLAAIADAYRYVQTGRKAAVVVIDVVTDPDS